jgi:hypothetical protein
MCPREKKKCKGLSMLWVEHNGMHKNLKTLSLKSSRLIFVVA